MKELTMKELYEINREWYLIIRIGLTAYRWIGLFLMVVATFVNYYYSFFAVPIFLFLTGLLAMIIGMGYYFEIKPFRIWLYEQMEDLQELEEEKEKEKE